MYKVQILVDCWPTQPAYPRQFRHIHLSSTECGIVLMENGGDIIFGGGAPPDAFTFRFCVLHTAFHARSYHRQFQLRKDASHLEKRFAHGVGLSVPAINRTVPSGVTEIADGAFSPGIYRGNVDVVIREIQMPDGIRRIGIGAFDGLTAIEKVYLPDSVKEIGVGAFRDCHALKSIHIPQGIAELKDSVFERCVGLCKVELPDGLKRINDHAFESCKALKEISIPHGVTTIGFAAFRRAGLETLYIPDTVKKVENQAVADMINLNEIWLSESIRKLEAWFLGQVNADEVRIHVIPESQLAKRISYKNLVYDYGV